MGSGKKKVGIEEESDTSEPSISATRVIEGEETEEADQPFNDKVDYNTVKDMSESKLEIWYSDRHGD